MLYGGGGGFCGGAFHDGIFFVSTKSSSNATLRVFIIIKKIKKDFVKKVFSPSWKLTSSRWKISKTFRRRFDSTH